ncbi:hypothetical protein [Streptomyces sp. NPDC096013]|uniref:hypothetical protein n=1 Tax=Streptomyces sp. NPDC096013 TaxID=3366069 RepID=UPI00380E62FB
MNAQNAGGVRRRPAGVMVDAHKEAHVLAGGVGRLHASLDAPFPFPFTITVADHASTGATAPVLPVGAPASLAEHLEYAS